MYTFEICTNSVKSCLAAQSAGAHRVELCAALPEGGTTPSYGEISLARESLSIRLHVIVRPRGGDFLYSGLEVQSMLRDIEMCRRLGVDGVVLGALTKEGGVDVSLMKELIAASEGMSVTFHRAFDMCVSPEQALEDIIGLGCERILTSGNRNTAEEGISQLRQLNVQAGGRIVLLAGSGVNESNIRRIADQTGITEFHFSARRDEPSQMEYRNPLVSMGGSVRVDEYAFPFTSDERVRETIHALR